MRALLLIPLVLLLGCEPNEMNQAESDAIKACLEKGWVPDLALSGSRRDFTCTPKAE